MDARVAREGSCEEYALLEDARASEHEHGLGIGCADARDAREKKKKRQRSDDPIERSREVNTRRTFGHCSLIPGG